jgi:hypothetical protein
MFAVMGYQKMNLSLGRSLLNSWRHLNRDGLPIFDARFRSAVIAH